MSRIFHEVPAFAPDYSGVASVLHDMGGMIVFCDVGGCYGNYAAFDEPRLGLAKRIFSIAFRESHLVMGIDHMAKEKIVESYKRVGGGFIALLGTPTATIIGTDFKGLAAEIEKETGVPVIYVETSGLDSYEKGQEKTYFALSDLAKYVAASCGDVHVIGATPLDSWDYGQKAEMVELLKRCGAKYPVIWGDADTMEALGSLEKAKLNIAVSVSGVKLAKSLKEQYGTPYRIGFPMGKEALSQWEKELREILSEKSDTEADTYQSIERNSGEGLDIRILIVGEQIASNMLRDMLCVEFGCEKVDVASFFEMDPSLAQREDFHADTESEYVERLAGRKKYDVIIGDRFLTRAVPYQTKVIQIPCIAISGLVFMRQSPVLFGEKGTLYFQKKIEEVLADKKEEKTCV